MSLFLKDIVHDLREKKLWPVAALLLLAIVAVPVVLLRSSEGAADAPPAGAAGGGQTEPAAIALSADEGDRASALERFSAKDPFKPHGPAAPRRTPTTPGTSTSSASSGGGATAGTLPNGGSGGSGGSASHPSTPARPTTPRADSTPRTETKTVAYTHTVDVRFGRRGAIRLRRGIARMDPIPNADRPLLVYLGTSASGHSAVFLVDQSLEQRGDGKCEPDRRNCALLYLRPEDGHDLHFFTDTEGRGYALRLVSIDLVPVSEVTEKAKERSASARRSGGDDDHRAALWPFDVAPFADLIR